MPLRQLASRLDRKLLCLRDLHAVGDVRDLEAGADTLYVVTGDDGCRKRIQVMKFTSIFEFSLSSSLQVIDVKEISTGKVIPAGLGADGEQIFEDEKAGQLEVWQHVLYCNYLKCLTP